MATATRSRRSPRLVVPTHFIAGQTDLVGGERVDSTIHSSADDFASTTFAGMRPVAG